MTNLPVSGIFTVTATYGQTGKYWVNGHRGIDISCGKREVYATCDGVVRVVAYDSGGWGYYISVGDGSGQRHIFCHLEKGSIRVKVGQSVDRSTVIARMGSTGNSTGVHLHYQINNADNVPVNPCPHLGIPNEKGIYDSADYKTDVPGGQKPGTAHGKEDDMTFKDADKIGKWARQAVDRVSDKGLMLGDSDGYFNPKNPLTREEAAVIIERLLDLIK